MRGPGLVCYTATLLGRVPHGHVGMSPSYVCLHCPYPIIIHFSSFSLKYLKEFKTPQLVCETSCGVNYPLKLLRSNSRELKNFSSSAPLRTSGTEASNTTLGLPFEARL